MNANLLSYAIGVLAGTSGFWLAYRLFIYNRPQHGLARTFLLIAMILPLLLPFFQNLLPARASQLTLTYALPEQIVGHSEPTAFNVLHWSFYLGVTYLLIAGIFLLRRVIAAIALRLRIKNAPRRQHQGIRVYTDTRYGPGSTGRLIFFPGEDVDTAILAHETGHVRLGHRYDLAFANLICCLGWINPFLWMLRRELRLVHEFEADAYAAANGASAEPYARLLLRQSFGLQAPAFSHSFFHRPIKHRISMLFKNETSPSNRAARMIVAGCSAAMIAASLLFVQCRQEVIAPEKPASNEVYKYVDQMPVFEGDLNGYMVNSIHYPEAARSEGKEGRCIVQFIVTQNGSVAEPTVVRSSGVQSLDDEAMRVVRNMPAWKPGMQRGKLVSVYFTLPITFKLDDGAEPVSGTFSSPDLNKGVPLTVRFSLK